MLVLLLSALLGLVPQQRVVLHAAMLEQEQRTLDLIYNMEFDAAWRAAQHLIDLAPAHPAGYFYRAATYWQRRLIAHEPRQRATLLSHFRESTQRARSMAESLPEAQAAEAAFYLGAVYGMQARMHFVEQQYISTLRTQELSPTLRAWVELRLGNVYDLQGERQAAQAWYQGVQGDEHAEARAHAYMAMPFMPAQIDLKPLEQAAI